MCGPPRGCKGWVVASRWPSAARRPEPPAASGAQTSGGCEPRCGRRTPSGGRPADTVPRPAPAAARAHQRESRSRRRKPPAAGAPTPFEDSIPYSRKPPDSDAISRASTPSTAPPPSRDGPLDKRRPILEVSERALSPEGRGALALAPAAKGASGTWRSPQQTAGRPRAAPAASSPRRVGVSCRPPCRVWPDRWPRRPPCPNRTAPRRGAGCWSRCGRSSGWCGRCG